MGGGPLLGILAGAGSVQPQQQDLALKKRGQDQELMLALMGQQNAVKIEGIKLTAEQVKEAQAILNNHAEAAGAQVALAYQNFIDTGHDPDQAAEWFAGVTPQVRDGIAQLAPTFETQKKLPKGSLSTADAIAKFDDKVPMVRPPTPTEKATVAGQAQGTQAATAAPGLSQAAVTQAVATAVGTLTASGLPLTGENIARTLKVQTPQQAGADVGTVAAAAAPGQAQADALKATTAAISALVAAGQPLTPDNIARALKVQTPQQEGADVGTKAVAAAPGVGAAASTQARVTAQGNIEAAATDPRMGRALGPQYQTPAERGGDAALTKVSEFIAAATAARGRPPTDEEIVRGLGDQYKYLQSAAEAGTEAGRVSVAEFYTKFEGANRRPPTDDEISRGLGIQNPAAKGADAAAQSIAQAEEIKGSPLTVTERVAIATGATIERVRSEDKDGKPIEITGVFGPDGVMQKEIGRGPIATGDTTITVGNIGPTGVDYGQPPTNMAWARDADGLVKLDERGVPTPLVLRGTPLDAANQKATTTAAAGDTQQSAERKLVSEDIGRAVTAINTAGFPTTGFIGKLTENVAGTSAYGVAKLIDGIKANVGFDKLQQMRAASPTGAALGPVSDFENRLLQSVLGSFDQGQSKEQLLFNLRRLDGLVGWIADGGVASGKNAPGAPAGFVAPKDTVWVRTAPDGREVVVKGGAEFYVNKR